MHNKPVLKILCEGQTEELFIKRMIAPYLDHLTVSCLNLNGGVNFEKFLKPIQILLHQNSNLHITTFIDYYGFQLSKDIRTEIEKNNLSCPREKATKLESELFNYLKSNLSNIDQNQCIIHVQPYEFEGLLFSDTSKFCAHFGESAVSKLQEIRNKFATPEHINNSIETAPSKRIEKLLGKAYGKNSTGIIIAEEIGLDKIQKECFHFKAWLEKLKNITTSTSN